jgi:hypothetical protein
MMAAVLALHEGSASEQRNNELVPVLGVQEALRRDGTADAYELLPPLCLLRCAAGDQIEPGDETVDEPVDIEALICSLPWPCEEAIAVARCESGLDPGAIDATGENFGQFQLNRATWEPYFGPERWARVLDARSNLEMAYEVYERGGGWGPWACKPLPDAMES